MCSDIFDQAMKPLEETLKHEEAPEVTKVLCIGGSSRIPGIRKRLEELCPDATVLCKMDPDQAIAIGAAYIAGTLMGVQEVPEEFDPVPIEEQPDHQQEVEYLPVDQPEDQNMDGDYPPVDQPEDQNVDGDYPPVDQQEDQKMDDD